MGEMLKTKWEHPNKLSEGLVNQIKEYYNEGYSCQKTAEKFGIGKTTVRSYVDVRPRNIITDSERKANSVRNVSKRRRKLKQMAVEYKGGSCVECGYKKCLGALEFHHLNPNEKDFAISGGGYSLSWEKIKIELDKCVLVCGNCHSEIHEKLFDC